MNKQAQTILVGVMISFIALVILVSLISPVKDFVTIARSNESGLNCASALDYDAARESDDLTCIIVDFWLPAFFGTGLAIAIGYIGWQFKKKKEEQ